MDTSLRISKFIRDTRYEELPGSVIHQTKRCLLDLVGCILAGIRTPIGKAIKELSFLFPQQKGVSILGVSQEVVPFMAAFGNGFLANALDADDGHRTARGHPGGVIIPAALAAAEILECDGKSFIEGIVVGYEIGLRTGLVINSQNNYFGSAHWATFGAAAAAAKIFNLENGQAIHALGISEMHTPACQLMGWIETKEIPMIKEGMGWSAGTGFMSAMMADKGMAGSLTIFNAKEEAGKVSSLGSDYEILKLYFKKYPACRWTHPALDSLLSIMEENKLNPDDVVSIRVKTLKNATLLNLREPKTIEEAQYSLPFVLGATLVEGSLGPEQMDESKLRNKHILEFARKVHLTVDKDSERKFPQLTTAKVEVETRQGQILRKATEKVKGDWDFPFSDQEMEEKFLRFSASSIPEYRAKEVIELIKGLQDVDNMRDFTGQFTYNN